MNRYLLNELINWPKYYITGPDLQALLPGTDNRRKAIVKRAASEGYLQQIKRDIYLITNISNKPAIQSFELAQLIYGPSYISYESSLSYHGWIPERVDTVCCATVKRSKSFNTPVGLFSFEKIPSTVFRLGVRHIIDDDAYYLMADPWKAIADMIYYRKKSWTTINDLIDDLRIDLNDLENSNHALLKALSKEYTHLLTRKTLRKFHKELQS